MRGGEKRDHRKRGEEKTKKRLGGPYPRVVNEMGD